MSDEKLHPEVEAAIQSGPHVLPVGESWPDGGFETPKEFARRIALLAASKAREEEREQCAKVAESTPTVLCENGDFFSERVAAAIRRGKP